MGNTVSRQVISNGLTPHMLLRCISIHTVIAMNIILYLHACQHCVTLCPLLTRQAGVAVCVIESITLLRWISSIELEGRRGVVGWHLPLRVTAIDESGYVS